MDKNTYSDLQEYKTNSFDILNLNSDISFLFSLKVPFQITYEYCSGITEQDYLNIVTFSENEPEYTQQFGYLHDYIFHNKASHFHDYYEFLIVLEGSLIQKIEDKEFLYPVGSCCLINRNLRHKERFLQSARVLFLGFSVDFIIRLLDSYQSAYFDIEKEMQKSLLYQFIIDDLKNPGKKAYLDFIPASQNTHFCTTLHAFAEQLITTMLFPKFGATHMVNALLCNILQYLSDSGHYHISYIELDNQGDYLLFLRVSHLLEENDGRISRSVLAKKLNYSSDYINRIVKKYSGLCLHDYGMTFCMKKAAYYLISTKESVSAIAAKLNFINRSHFYDAFKKQYGMTPKEYRNLKVKQ